MFKAIPWCLQKVRQRRRRRLVGAARLRQ